MQPGELAAWISAGFAGAAAVVATVAAVAAFRQARIAEQQLQLHRTEHDQRDAPTFAIEAADSAREQGTSSTKITVRQERGPALSTLAVTVTSDYLNGVLDTDSAGLKTNTVTFAGMRPGGAQTFHVGFEQGYIGSTVDIDLVSTERDGGRTWTDHRSLTIPKPPPRSRVL